MLPPTVPSKSDSSRATPYSVTAVPRIGISLVPAAAACRDAVAFARIRSTLLDTNPLIIVEQVLESPCAFCSSNFTPSSPNSSTRASSKPLVAASSASCCTSWQIPILNTLSEAALSDALSSSAVSSAVVLSAAEVSSFVLLPHAVTLTHIVAARSSAANFFMTSPPFFSNVLRYKYI